MTVTSVNLINKPLANRVDADIKELANLFAAQQAAENRRKVTAPRRLVRKGILGKLRLRA